jgi:acyl-CoA hydrolase
MEFTWVSRLVRAADLNHHGTLFAGETAKWMVEACFIAAAKKNKRTDNAVCVNIQGLQFKRPIQNGDVIDIESFAAHVGTTSITVVGRIHCSRYGDQTILETAVTFVTVDEKGRPTPHNISMERPEDPELQAYWDRFESYKKRG